MPLWRFVLKNAILKYVVLVMLFFFSSFYELPTRILCFDRLIGYSFWFYLGILISETNLVEFLFKKYKGYLLLIGVILYVVSILVFKSNMNFLATFGAIAFSYGLALFMDEHYPQALKSFRNYTYQIFLMGIFAQIVVKMLYKRIDAPYILMYGLCVLVGLYVPVFVSKLLEKINSKALLICVGLKRK